MSSPLLLVLATLALVGIVHVWTESAIGRPFRMLLVWSLTSPYDSLAYCPRCAAFWAAPVVAAIAAFWPWGLVPFAGVGAARFLWGPILGVEDAATADMEAASGARDREDRAGPAAAAEEFEEGDQKAGTEADPAGRHPDGSRPEA